MGAQTEIRVTRIDGVDVLIVTNPDGSSSEWVARGDFLTVKAARENWRGIAERRAAEINRVRGELDDALFAIGEAPRTDIKVLSAEAFADWCDTQRPAWQAESLHGEVLAMCDLVDRFLADINKEPK